MKRIELYSKNDEKKVVMVDDEDFERLSKFTWYLQIKSNNRKYAHASINGKHVRMHRFILNMDNNNYLDVDHKDHNGLNNQKSNLRPCTRSQNMANSYVKKGKSKYKGVTWNSSSKKWIAKIRLNYQLKHIGCYYHEIDATFAYDAYAKKYFGEFARLNLGNYK